MSKSKFDLDLEIFEKDLVEANNQLLHLHRRMVHIGDELYEDGQLEAFEHTTKILEDLKQAIYALKNYRVIDPDKINDEIRQIRNSYEVR